jgi:hypothetical protein
LEIDVTKPKLSPVEVLRRGEDWSSYSARYDNLVAAEFQTAAMEKQRAEEKARRALIDQNFKRRRAEELSWNPLMPGLTITCVSCGAEVYVFGTHRDGFPDDDAQQPHLFRESVDGHAVLTAKCRCGRSIALDLGKLSATAPSNFISIRAMEKIAPHEAPITANGEKRSRPGLRERLLGAVQ